MATDADFELAINTDPLTELDKFALLACQSYNFGNSTDWFGVFRGGYYGLCSRLYGVKTHYRDVHSWIARPRLPVETEYHVSSILFGMDSAIECFTFMLNALGRGAVPTGFRDVTDGRALRRVAPRDILGEPNTSQPSGPLQDYKIVFPNLKAYWQSNRQLVAMIMEQHDVSKHRETVYSGGMARKDPPPGFYEKLGVQDDPAKQALFWAHAEILLKNDPKEPRGNRTPTPYEDRVVLESIVDDFCEFIQESCVTALNDARTNIHLTYDQLQSS